jgi:hypothetical protein
MLPLWGENNRNEMAAGRGKTPDIRPILIDRELPLLETRLDDLDKIAGQGGEGHSVVSASPPVGGPQAEAVPGAKAAPEQGSSALTGDQKRQFIDLTNQIKLLTDRRAQILARTGDDYVVAPSKIPGKP